MWAGETAQESAGCSNMRTPAPPSTYIKAGYDISVIPHTKAHCHTNTYAHKINKNPFRNNTF